MPNMINFEDLRASAIDQRNVITLATNFGDVVPDCTGLDASPKTELQNRFPLLMWLMDTALSREVRRDRREGGACVIHKADGKWVMEVPRTIWTTTPESSSEECCWAPMDFAKCAPAVPINLLCLKDCDSIMDDLMGNEVINHMRVEGIASDGETMNAIKKRVARLSMAFYTAYTAILGMDNTYTNILKPFHGLLQVMSNPAVISVAGTDIFSAFKQIGCRLAVLGDGDYVFAVNPIVYQSILDAIVPNQYGQYPFGWTRNGDEVRYMGRRFLQDKLVPVDLTNGTGEIWILDGQAVGLWLATDLQPTDYFIRQSGHKADTPANGCGSDCWYYYNLGAAFNNNANRLMKIVDVPIANACASALADLGNLIAPTTLIPKA